MNIELYIANTLCDLEKSNLSIKLKRQFFNPTELNTKDAQKSYSITLPSTPTNDEIFRYSNVEEVEGKFSIYPDARLYVNSILLLEGKFRLTQITRDSYIGNLGVPALLTAKDIFGEMKMNEAGEWLLHGFDSIQAITKYNLDKNSDCIFPLTLYSTMPYNQFLTGTNQISMKNLEITDFPPSTNCMKLMQKLFESAKYKLSGSALSDERLKNLFVSYRNPVEYEMPYCYQKVVLKGNWTNRGEINAKLLTHPYYGRHEDDNNSSHEDHSFVACDIFRSTQKYISPIEDQSFLWQNLSDSTNRYKVPRSGLYKIKLKGEVNLLPQFERRRNELTPNELDRLRKQEKIVETIIHEDGQKTHIVLHEYKKNSKNTFSRDFQNLSVELKLVRTNEDTFDLEKATFDNYYTDFSAKAMPKRYVDKNILPYDDNTHFISSEKNPHLVSGLAWGRATHDNYKTENIPPNLIDGDVDRQESDANNYYQIPEFVNKNQPINMAGNIIAPLYKAKSESGNYPKSAISAVYSPGYKNKKYNVDMKGTTNSVKLYEAKSHVENIREQDILIGTGEVSQIMWLDAGENISLITVMDRGREAHWVYHTIDFEIEIEPFSDTADWLTEKMDSTTSSSIEAIDFNTDPLITKNTIDLIKFQPSEVKVDDWVSNFCKAFNLDLVQVAKDEFELNIKDSNSLSKPTAKIIDLDQKANVNQASNENMALPSMYELGFTVNTSEQGYVNSLKNKEDLQSGDKGGGKFPTGSNETKTIKHNSNFSHCWYHPIPMGETKVAAPILTDKEVWQSSMSKEEADKKKYFNSPQRFWYRTGETSSLYLYGRGNIYLAEVSDTYRGNKNLELNYEDKPNSIMRNFFTLLTNEKNYTVVECYLSPEEYADLGNSNIKFNGDLYIVAEADGYDPMGKSKTKLKLIKKM